MFSISAIFIDLIEKQNHYDLEHLLKSLNPLLESDVLRIAMCKKDFKSIEIVLRHASFNLLPSYFLTTLVHHSKYDCIRLLFKKHLCFVNINIMDHMLNTHLHNACATDDMEYVKILLEFGAIQQKGSLGRYPLFYALRNQNFEIRDALLEALFRVEFSLKEIKSCRNLLKTILLCFKRYKLYRDLISYITLFSDSMILMAAIILFGELNNKRKPRLKSLLRLEPVLERAALCVYDKNYEMLTSVFEPDEIEHLIKELFKNWVHKLK